MHQLVGPLTFAGACVAAWALLRGGVAQQGRGFAGMASQYVVLYVTAPSEDSAKIIARKLVETRLAACVNTIPNITSTYTWEGKVSVDKEVLLMVKSKASLVPEIAATVKAVHSYQVPEVIAVPILGGLDSYLNWIEENTKDGEDSEFLSKDKDLSRMT
eukprot:m.32188 g.32188  ORF g.32188 m.32188 type:complete len:159 (-) comp10851_c0_seq1:263-739(-)